ncbi:MAG: type IV secretion protein IcmX [Gammaproteobacteria bacterium]|nr:type IV secretion protein IcmX [Gammaproteobacteria bacterium]
MHRLRHVVSGILLLASFNIHAEDTSSGGDPSAGEESLEKLIEYFVNFGGYLGFDVTQEKKDPIATLLDISGTTLLQQYSFVTLLGAIPVNAYSKTLAYFVPSNTENYSAINDMANYTFAKQPDADSGSYDQAKTGESGGISVSALIDRTNNADDKSYTDGEFQSDPVTQYVLNILTTPQTTFCMDNAATAWKDDCTYLYDTKVMTNVIGNTPSTAQVFGADFNESIAPQLNGNTLLGPLLYSTEAEETGDSGLTAQNQAQEAQNFIRYATRRVTPPTLPKFTEYNDVYSQAVSSDDVFKQKLAQERIAKYLTKLRTFSAQSSVPTANLYSILSKRMPQAQSSDNSKKTSQALSEYQMATRRLYDPSKTDENNGKQWIDQINEASSATIQKEMVVLLSEINYQLYLSRMQDERSLATLSLILMQTLTAPSFSTDAKIETVTESDDSSG